MNGRGRVADLVSASSKARGARLFVLIVLRLGLGLGLGPGLLLRPARALGFEPLLAPSHPLKR